MCLHGFVDTWRTWELVLPALEREHDVLALTLAGHAGGPPIDGEITDAVLVDAVERAMDEAGFETAHIAGNSLGGYVALQLAARGRARTVVALAPAGGWAQGDESFKDTLGFQSALLDLAKAAAPHAEAVLASADGRRRATRHIVTNFEHIPAELLAHQLRGVASCDAARPLIDHAYRVGWPLDAERITCPVRMVWGTDDRLLPWPSAAARFRDDWLPHADWVELDGVGHCPQLDIPLETAQLILGFTGAGTHRSRGYSHAMSATEAPTIVTGVDFVSVPTSDLERAVHFYGTTLGLRRSAYRPERNFAEFETGTVTLSVLDPERMGVGSFQANANHLALHVEDVAAARATLEERGVTFTGDIFDTGVCHMAFFTDPDGNALMLHHRYAPRVPES